MTPLQGQGGTDFQKPYIQINLPAIKTKILKANG